VFVTVAALVAPAFAATQTVSGEGIGMGRTDHGMMSRGMMSRGMMGGGCAEMMQSMSGESERPNGQWRSPGHDGLSMPK
jgi:hypothetical protein